MHKGTLPLETERLILRRFKPRDAEYMFKRKIKRSIIVILCLFLILILGACSSDYNKVIETNWEIPLPKSYEELYSIDSGASFHGDGYRYHVFSYKEELKQNEIAKFSSEKNVNVEKEVENILISLKVSKESRPDFSEEYYWYKKNDNNDLRNNLYLIYFIQDKMLHIIEEFY